MSEPAHPQTHEKWCEPGERCVECGGCDCGLEASVCDGPGCYSVDAYLQDCDEDDRDPNDGPYGVVR